jgi:hypothetical protein
MSISTLYIPEGGINFNFDTAYMGSEITLNVIYVNGRFSVLHNDSIIGHIKPGAVRHTWYVVDSNYTPSYLVDQIGNRILAECSQLLAAA